MDKLDNTDLFKNECKIKKAINKLKNVLINNKTMIELTYQQVNALLAIIYNQGDCYG